MCVCVCVCVCVYAIKLLKAKDQKCILFYNLEIITILSTFQNTKHTYIGWWWWWWWWWCRRRRQWRRQQQQLLNWITICISGVNSSRNFIMNSMHICYSCLLIHSVTVPNDLSIQSHYDFVLHFHCILSSYIEFHFLHIKNAIRNLKKMKD